MKEIQSWDWQTPLKEIPVQEWADRFNWVEEPCITPDGEAVASIVNLDEMAFGICVNGQLWEGEYEKAWSLKAFGDRRHAVAVCQDEEWQLLVDGQPWSNSFDFVWNLQFSPDGDQVGMAYQKDMEYGMAVNDSLWEEGFENITGTLLGPGGVTAAIVQAESMPAADVEAFAKGIFGVAVNGECGEQRFLNAWDLSFSRDGNDLAWAVRLDREAYGVAVNGALWEPRFQAVWRPVFGQAGVMAPVRTNGKWRLFQDGAQLWDGSYENIWHLQPSPSGTDIAAIVATSFGTWSVAVNDRPWSTTWDTMVRELIYSPDGNGLAAVFKDKGAWGLAVNDRAWRLSCDKIFTPSMSPDGAVVAVSFEREGQWYTAVNDKVVAGPCEMMADPVVSPDGKAVLVKGVENGVYKRRVIVL
jgi:hypothetical protein